MKERWFNHDGYVKASHVGKHTNKAEGDGRRKYTTKAEIEVCGSCPKADCRGGAKCKVLRKALEERGKENEIKKNQSL